MREQARAAAARPGRLLRDLAGELADALAILSDEPSEEAVAAARRRLESARETLSLLLLTRSAAREGQDRTTTASG